MEETSNSSGNKRLLGDPEETPETKRIRPDVLDILAYDLDDTDSGDHGSADGDLACVMQSLQKEISVSLPAAMPAEETVEADGLGMPDLDYLLEASDDELGLPPTVDVSSVTEAVGEVEEAGYGQTWGFGDEVQPSFYDDLDYGAVTFDDGQFQYDDLFAGTADFFETTRRSESLPAM